MHRCWFDFELSCKKQISRNIFAIRKLSTYIDYGCTYDLLRSFSWSSGICNLDRIFALQKKIVRKILGLRYNKSGWSHFTECLTMALPSSIVFETFLHIKTNIQKYTSFNHLHNLDTRCGATLVVTTHMAV